MLNLLRLPGLISWGALAVLSSLTPLSARTTVYVSKTFEVRDPGQPVKYVFNGDTRVARVTGSLSANSRTQRLRLHPGWNLCSVAVQGSPLPLGGEAEEAVAAAYKWSQPNREWLPVFTNEPLAAGDVLWLHATTHATLALTGAYSDPANRLVEAGGSFQSGAGFEALPLAGMTPDAALWSFDATSQQWQRHLPAIPFSDAGFPELVAPGEAVFVNAGAPAELEVPEAALRIRYYHPDHLGSSSVMTDANGALVEETAYYPFGHPRHEHQPRQIEDPYQFTQKEQDQESGLHYFESRYLHGAGARFITSDPMYANPDGLPDATLGAFLQQPQKINLYAYGLNNPIRYNDPNGLDAKDTASTAADVAGVGAGIFEEASLAAYRSGFNPSGGGAVGVVGKAATGVSVGIKTYDFIKDPSYATGGQLANEGAKTLVGIAAPPVGLVWAVLDLTGYGPSAILEHTEKSIQANREAARLYTQTAQIYGRMAAEINQAEPVLRGQLQQIGAKVAYVNQAAKKVRETAQKSLQGDNRSLEQLNAEIGKLEGQLRHQKRELNYWKGRERKAR